MVSEIQSIIFDRDIWTVRKAVEWLRLHQFKFNKIDLPFDAKTIRFRQQSPGKFKRFRIKNIGRSIKFIFGFK